jgi:hypothetical protein
MPVATTQPDGTTVQSAEADAAPPVSRAPDDVGGLLDTSKGWALHIPGPDESDGAAKTIAAQQGAAASASKEIATASAGIASGIK